MQLVEPTFRASSFCVSPARRAGRPVASSASTACHVGRLVSPQSVSSSIRIDNEYSHTHSGAAQSSAEDGRQRTMVASSASCPPRRKSASTLSGEAAAQTKAWAHPDSLAPSNFLGSHGRILPSILPSSDHRGITRGSTVLLGEGEPGRRPCARAGRVSRAPARPPPRSAPPGAQALSWPAGVELAFSG